MREWEKKIRGKLFAETKVVADTRSVASAFALQSWTACGIRYFFPTLGPLRLLCNLGRRTGMINTGIKPSAAHLTHLFKVPEIYCSIM